MIRPPLRPGDIVRIRDERWRVRRYAAYESAALVSVDGIDRDNRGRDARFLFPAERIDRLPASPLPKRVGPRQWRRSVRRIVAEAVPAFESLRAAAAARLTIVPFQLEPALAITAGLGTRLLIADAVGLGKTVQAALIAAEVLHRQPDGRVLVVAPASLRDQWANELSARVGLIAANLDAAAVMHLGAPGAHHNPWSVCPLIVTSIDYVKRPEVLRALEGLIWDAVVFDEAHALSGASDRAAAAHGLARRARVVVMLSATPHSGDPAAFSRLCGIGRLANEPLLVFRRTRQAAGLPVSRCTRMILVRPNASEVAMHQALVQHARLVWSQPRGRDGARLAMTVLLKRACSSPAALARSIERRLQLITAPETPADLQLALPLEGDACDVEPVGALAVPGLEDAAEEARQLQAILDLARAATRHDSKMRALVRLIRRARQPVIVFTEYRDTLDCIQTMIPVRSVQLHGGLTATERREALTSFTTGDASVLIATDAASEGLNLQQRCRLVITLELPWTPTRLEQRIGRVDRIGQTRRVHAVHLVGRGTPEEDTVVRLVMRSGRAREALEAEPVDEQTVALAIAGEPQVTVSPRPSSPQAPPARALLFPTLADAAAREARRLVSAHNLLEGAGTRIEVGRPLVARVRRRRNRPQQCYWAYTVGIVDADGLLCWSMLAAAATQGPCPPSDGRALHGAFHALGPHVADAMRGNAPAAPIRTAARWTERALERERDIARDLRRTRARLAALQPSLFDRRADRVHAAHTRILDDGLAQCASRMLALERMRTLTVGTLEPTFALLIG